MPGSFTSKFTPLSILAIAAMAWCASLSQAGREGAENRAVPRTLRHITPSTRVNFNFLHAGKITMGKSNTYQNSQEYNKPKTPPRPYKSDLQIQDFKLSQLQMERLENIAFL